MARLQPSPQRQMPQLSRPHWAPVERCVELFEALFNLERALTAELLRELGR
jgi:hypothetical protein